MLQVSKTQPVTIPAHPVKANLGHWVGKNKRGLQVAKFSEIYNFIVIGILTEIMYK